MAKYRFHQEGRMHYASGMRLVHERTTDLVALTARLVDARGNNADAVVLSAGCLVVHISRLYAARPRHIGRLRHVQGKMCVHCICIAPPSHAIRGGRHVPQVAVLPASMQDV
ncbi:hypothetical protein C8F04DRAFT_1268548 [Mycena alexandri]|uniref:Uncharacterized protein n=1 Tax=Mycena alexandri TaxID=1745969 RepID=A0AAD6WUV6_9AGAR|nr:hypothetical protein C8F04DRAFT_1268548 [Mycena alexandri]